jgi:hypothetical protein
MFVLVERNFLQFYISKIQQKAKIGLANFSVRVFQLGNVNFKKMQSRSIDYFPSEEPSWYIFAWKKLQN